MARSKGKGVRPSARKVRRDSLSRATSTAIASECLSRSRRGGPHTLSATCKLDQSNTEEGAATSCRFSVLCVPRQQTEYRLKQTRHETTRRTSEGQGAKQRGAKGRKTEKCGCSLLESGYRRTLVLDCRSKGEYLAVHSQKSKTRRWLYSSFSAEREVLDVQEESVYRTRPSEGDWSVPRRALAMPR